MQEKYAKIDEDVKDLSELLESTLSSHLTPREANVLRLRFGLEDGQIRKLAEVGQAINRLKSTAWRVEAQAIKKLRGLSFMQEFQKFTGESSQ